MWPCKQTRELHLLETETALLLRNVSGNINIYRRFMNYDVLCKDCATVCSAFWDCWFRPHLHVNNVVGDVT